MKKWKKALALLLAMAMCLSMLSVSAFAEGDDATDPGTEQGSGDGEGGGPGGDMGGGPGGPGGGSTASGAETIEVSGMEGMLSLEKYVFEDTTGSITVKCYGTYRADSAEGEEAYGVAAATAGDTYGVYTDSDLLDAAGGVTASVSDSGELQIEGVATEGNVVYYLWNGETDSVATIIYVVNDEYDENSATLTLANGDTVEITTYAPNMANGDYDSSQAAVNESGSVYIGGNRTVTDAEYYGITDEYADAVDWYLSSGITNGGYSLEEFGENMYNFEYVVAMYRMFQLVNEQMTFTSDFVDATDYVAGMGSNDQFSDAVSATMMSGIWNGIYTQYSETLLPTQEGTTATGYLLENITDEDGEIVTTELGVFNTTTVEFVYVGLYNAFQSAWSQLSDEGVAAAEAMAAVAAAYDGETKTAPDDYSNEAKIIAVASVLSTFADDGSNPDWNWVSDMIYACVAAGIIKGRDDNTYDTQGNLLRSEAAALIARAYGLTSDATVSSFPDVSSDHWALQDIEACAEAGIILGRDDGTFDPDATITRAEMAAMIARAEGLTSDVTTSSFPDVSSSHWALQEIEACYVAGIVEGDNGNYRPEDNITRAEIAMILGRTIDIGSVALTKEQSVAALYSASGCVESVSYADAETAAAIGSSYADMTQYFGNIYTGEGTVTGGIVASSADTWLITTSVDLTDMVFGVQSDDTGNVIYAEDANTGIDGMAAAFGGIQAEYADATEGYGFVYNATFRNAYYREGIGSGVAIVGEDTVVNLTSTDGSLVLSGSGGSMSGTAYVAFGATLKISNSAAYSASQHLTNNLYNGTIYYYESLAYGTGRLYSSDFWGGYQVYENSVGYGGNVTDEPTTLIVKNSVYSNSVGGNGFASQYFENSVLNVGTASFHNTTSLITDVGGLTLVNSVMNNTSGTLVSVSKGENVIVTLVDSTINMSGNSVASISASTSINHNASLDKDSEDWVSDEYAAMFDSEVYIYVYGDTTINTSDGTLTADVADGATLKIFVSETNAALEALAASNENIEIVIGEEYGTLTVLVDGLTYNEDGTVSFNAKDFCSFGSGGTSDEDNDYAFTAYLYLSSGAELYNGTGVSAEDGTYTGIEIEDGISGRNGIVVVDSDTTFDGLTISLITDADGSDTCDFSGKGSALAVYGDSNVTVKNATIETTGVATMPVFVDDGATVTIYSSTLKSNGGTIYESYLNSPSQDTMVAPPWILGIMGTSRCTNLMGTDSTMNVIDSATSAGAWAVLSTDSGTNMYLNIYNTSLTLNNADESAAAALQDNTNGGAQIYTTYDDPYTTNYGSGYGTYAIGAAVETFAGATVNVGTYATIFTGGSATYTSIEAGETYTLASADGENDVTYTATESKVTTINSDTFGFMIHQGDNTITIEKGTVINSGYATFLMKSGSSGANVTATIDDAEINNGGVLIQVMDNDDATTGMDVATFSFVTTHAESAGFASEAADADSTVQSFTFTNGDYTGNIYNGSGTDRSSSGPLDATTLDVTFGEGATYAGAVASTAAIHVTYEGSVAVKNTYNGYAFEDAASASAFALTYQNTSFDITHYYDIGQVANMILENGAPINITLTDDAVWTVTGTSVISSLTLSGDAKVIVPENVTLTVGGTVYTGTTLTADEGGEEVDTGAGIEGMLSLKTYSVDSTDTTVSIDYYGMYTASNGSDAAAYVVDETAAPTDMVVYADQTLTTVMDGVTATVADGKLTIAGLSGTENTVCYIAAYEGARTTIVYIVADEVEDSYTQQLRDGTTVDLTEYAPVNGTSDVYIGGNQSLYSASDFSDLDNATAEEIAVANWWLGAGITNGGVSTVKFGSSFYVNELTVYLYRNFQLMVDEDKGSDTYAEPTNYSGAMGSNDQFGDAVPATLYSGSWDGIFTTWNEEGYLENIDGVTTIPFDQQVDEEILMVTLYNTLNSTQAFLTEKGESIRDAINAAAGENPTNAAKVAAVESVLGVNYAELLANSTSQKLAVLTVLSKLDDCTTSITGYEETTTTDSEGNAVYVPYTMPYLMSQLTDTIITSSSEIVNSDALSSTNSTAAYITGGNAGNEVDVSIVNSTITGAGDVSYIQELIQYQAPFSLAGYNLTAANAFYRYGIGALLPVHGYNTHVSLTSTDGTLILSGPADGEDSGGLYTGFGSTISVTNGVVYSAGQHPSNTCYNGTLHYVDSGVFGTIRQFSSDFWGGYIVFENSVSVGRCFADEPTTIIFKNSYTDLDSLDNDGSASWINMTSMSSLYLENSVVDHGHVSFTNNTSLLSDTTSLTMVNTTWNGRDIASVTRSAHVVITLVDSTVNLTTDSVLTINQNITQNMGETVLEDNPELAEYYNVHADLKIQGDVYLNTPGTATFTFGSDEALETGSITIYAANIYGELDMLETNVTWVQDEAYGDLYVNYATVTGEVSETIAYDGTVVVQDVTAPDGYMLTMTVDGVQVALENGTYTGNVVLTVTEKISGIYDSNSAWGGMTSAWSNYRAAVYVEDDAVVAAKSVSAALISGEVTDTSASNVYVHSEDSSFNGIIVYNSDYTVDGMVMIANGSGTSDFYGDGAAVAVGGGSNVTVNDLIFFSNGYERQGVYVGGSEANEDGSFATAYVTVNDSYIRASNENDSSTGVTGCPWMLGINPLGTIRATMLDGYAVATYNNTILLSDGWGILSTDDMGEPTEWGVFTGGVVVNNSVVDVTTDTFTSETGLSAYGTYAIGACKNVFNDSVIGNANESDLYKTLVAKLASGYDYDYDTEEYGLTYACIIANEYASVEYNGCSLNTKYGVMYHKTNNVTYVTEGYAFPYTEDALENSASTVAAAGTTVVNGSNVKTYGAAFVIKACTPVIEVTNSTLYYGVVVFIAPLQGLCYTVKDAVDWLIPPTTRWFLKGSNHSPLQVC